MIQTKRSIAGLLDKMRALVKDETGLTQNAIDELTMALTPLREVLRPGENDELFAIVDQDGNSTGLSVPRWICHSIGLRHRVVEIMLTWRSLRLGDVYLLQMRSWSKSNSPGHLDISVAGHVKGASQDSIRVSAMDEMHEELGLTTDQIIGGRLQFRCEYNHDDNVPSINFYNSERRIVFMADVTTEVFNSIEFRDKEVVGLYLCPKCEARNLLAQKHIPLSSALLNTLPRLLDSV